MQKIAKGAASVDDLLNKYPILKKLSGPIIAGLLIWMWMNMSYIGDIDYDLDFTSIINALKGSFSVYDLFASPSGLMMVSLLGAGMVGISVPWLTGSLIDLVIALVFTASKKMNSNSQLVRKLKSKIKKGKYGN
jgi:hypothetical protein